MSKRSRLRSIFSTGVFEQNGNVGQDDVPARFTMGTTTALSRQAVINGAVIKPAKHEADGFRWLEGWPSRCFGKTTPVQARRAARLHFSTLSSRRHRWFAPSRPLNIFYFLFWHCLPTIHFSIRLNAREMFPRINGRVTVTITRACEFFPPLLKFIAWTVRYANSVVGRSKAGRGNSFERSRWMIFGWGFHWAIGKGEWVSGGQICVVTVIQFEIAMYTCNYPCENVGITDWIEASGRHACRGARSQRLREKRPKAVSSTITSIVPRLVWIQLRSARSSPSLPASNDAPSISDSPCPSLSLIHRGRDSENDSKMLIYSRRGTPFVSQTRDDSLLPRFRQPRDA